MHLSYTGVEYCVVYSSNGFTRTSKQINRQLHTFFLFTKFCHGVGQLGKVMKKRYKTLLDDDLLFGYKEIVLYYESKVKRHPKDFKVARIKKSLKLLAMYQDDLQTVIEPIHRQMFEKEPVSFFAFGDKYDSKVPSLIYHLRNAYAHNCVERENIKGVDFLCFMDKYRKQTTMLGQIPYSEFSGFIAKLKEARTPEKENEIEPLEEIIY